MTNPLRLSRLRSLLRIFAIVWLASAGMTLAAPLLPAMAQDGDARIVVADVRGPLEQRALDFLTEAVETPDAVVVILQLDNPGIASGDPAELFAAIEGSPAPVAAWVGPSGAEAYGGVVDLLLLADHTAAAPGTHVGYLEQRIAGGARARSFDPAIPKAIVGGSIEVAEPVDGVVDAVVPTVGQFIASLDGQDYVRNGEALPITTVRSEVDDAGNEITVAAHEVEFRKPGLFTRSLRLAMRPEAMFFFLVAGIAAAVFEFYAAGAGISASISVLTLFLAGFGLASLPVNWLSVVLVLFGMWLYTVDFQNAVISWRGLLGSVLLLWGGWNITAADPQFASRWWAVVLAVIGVASFYMIALTTVTRSRFSTITIGREHLVGRVGVAETGFDPMGIVEVDGARWQARSHRAAGLSAGDPVEVLAVSGIMLEVGPPASDGASELEREKNA